MFGQLRLLSLIGLFALTGFARSDFATTSLSTRGTASLSLTFTKTTDLSQPTATVALSSAFSLANGITNAQADQGWGKVDTIAASGTKDWDFRGTLTNVLGDAFAPVEVVTCQINAAATNTNNVIVGNVTNGFVGGFASATQSWAVVPGGVFFWYAPVGYATTAGTADLVHVANSGGGTSVVYSILCAGRSA